MMYRRCNEFYKSAGWNNAYRGRFFLLFYKLREKLRDTIVFRVKFTRNNETC